MRNPILLAPRALPSSLFSFEALLVLYMFAGIYKGDSRFAWLPVDATALFFTLSVVAGSFIIVVNPIYRKGLPVVFAMVCLVVWLLVSLMWSPSRVYGPDKVLFMASLGLWALIGGALVIAPNPERVRRLFTLLLLLSILVGVDTIVAYAEAGGRVQRIDVESGSYLGLGRICGLGALVALVAWLSSGGFITRWLCLGLFLGLCFVLAVGGGRGPLLATGLALLVPLGFSVRLTTRRILYSPSQLSVLVLLVVVSAGLATFAAVTDQRLGTIERLEGLVTGDLGSSASQRLAFYSEAKEAWSDAPLLGHGVGSWPLLTGGADVVTYPHNLFAELLVEGGLIALGLFLAVLGAALRPVSLERLRHPQALCVMMLFVSAFLNAMVSGDLPGNRAVFMLIGVLALLAARPVGVTAPTVAPLQAAAAPHVLMPRRRVQPALREAEPGQ